LTTVEAAQRWAEANEALAGARDALKAADEAFKAADAADKEAWQVLEELSGRTVPAVLTGTIKAPHWAPAAANAATNSTTGSVSDARLPLHRVLARRIYIRLCAFPREGEGKAVSAARRKAVTCTHFRPEEFRLLDETIVEWCPACGALREEGVWRMPGRAAPVPAVVPPTSQGAPVAPLFIRQAPPLTAFPHFTTFGLYTR
jgi:hypothetical protein